MNQKKCPKCGELNPQEAVMCWACYTPLTGDSAAATATTAAARKPAPPSGNTRAEKDKVAVAPWQIGVVVAALLAAGVAGFMMMGGSGDTETVVANQLPVLSPDKMAIPGKVRPGAPGITMPSGGGGGAPTVSMPQRDTSKPSFSITTAPARNTQWATVGIVPTTSVSGDQARALALAARKQVMAGQQYKGAYIYVFGNRNVASVFQKFQRSNRGAPLSGDDYSSLSEIWPETLVRYEFNAGNEDIRFPSQSPNDWWSRESNYTKATQ